VLFEDGPAVLVDMSNVCRDRSLCTEGKKADFRAFTRVLSGLKQSPWKLGGVLAIADRNLHHFFNREDLAQYRKLEEKGIIRETPIADDLLIAYAFEEGTGASGGVIVSMDGFADFRPQYPEIQGSTDRFIGWKVTSSAQVRLFYRDMGVFTHQKISRKVEEGEFKARKILHTSVRDRAVRLAYRCANPVCDLARNWPDMLPEMPEYDRRDDSFRCPECGQRVEYAGSRTPTSQVIVFHDGRERRRILLEDGQTIVFGRKDRKGAVLGPGRDIPESAAKQISREHLRLSMIDGMVTVEDLGSKNGTAIESRRGSDRRVLRKGDEVPLVSRVRLRLPGDIVLELSGRRNPFAGDNPNDLTVSTDPGAIDETIALY